MVQEERQRCTAVVFAEADRPPKIPAEAGPQDWTPLLPLGIALRTQADPTCDKSSGSEELVCLKAVTHRPLSPSIANPEEMKDEI